MHEIRHKDTRGTWPVTTRFTDISELPEDLRRIVALLDACDLAKHRSSWCKYIKGVGLCWSDKDTGEDNGYSVYYIGFSWEE